MLNHNLTHAQRSDILKILDVYRHELKDLWLSVTTVPYWQKLLEIMVFQTNRVNLTVWRERWVAHQARSKSLTDGDAQTPTKKLKKEQLDGPGTPDRKESLFGRRREKRSGIEMPNIPDPSSKKPRTASSSTPMPKQVKMTTAEEIFQLEFKTWLGDCGFTYKISTSKHARFAFADADTQRKLGWFHNSRPPIHT